MMGMPCCSMYGPQVVASSGTPRMATTWSCVTNVLASCRPILGLLWSSITKTCTGCPSTPPWALVHFSHASRPTGSPPRSPERGPVSVSIRPTLYVEPEVVAPVEEVDGPDAVLADVADDPQAAMETQ